MKLKDHNEGGEKHLITSDFSDWGMQPEAGRPIEMASIEDQKDRLVTASENLVDDTKTMIGDSVGWLPHFSEQYNISADLKDYVLVPVTIMPSDLPNRNAQGFPLEELTRANPETGQIGFETWSRKPAFYNHNNTDHTKAKGVILSSIMKPMRGSVGNLFKVICLTAFDRKADPMLANKILTGEINAYSMGAMASFFTCSACGEHHTSKHQGCEHVSVKAPRFKHLPNDRLAYLQARYINGFENSAVHSPAYYSAQVDPTKHLR
jgi:hypothetical protein